GETHHRWPHGTKIINPSFNFIFLHIKLTSFPLILNRHLLKAPAADDDDGDETEEEKKLQRGVRLLRRTPRSPKRVSPSLSLSLFYCKHLRYQEAHDHQLYTKLE
ncbi:unnamed protein product, partial [Brassica oleracea]